jgi:phenylacetate-CoA ligase
MPTIFGLTAEGMNTFKNMWFRWFVTATCKPGYSFQICGARWHAGWPGLDMAAAEYGMTTICTDLLVALHPFMLQRNLYYAQQLKPDVIFAFPSTITRMEELAKSQGIDPKEIIKYKIMLLGGELLTDTMRKRVEKEYGSEVFQFGGVGGDVYNNVVECTEHDGPHWQEDLWLIENLDPEKLEPLGTGERGNLVLTNLWNQAIPHLRFRTEDAFTFETERCGCGRTHMRGWQLGRVIDIVTVQQKPILPADVENILRETPETETAEYMVVRYATGSLDKLKVKTTYDTKKTKDPAELKVRLEKIISDRLGVPCELEFVSEEEIKASQAKLKAVRVLDLTK